MKKLLPILIIAIFAASCVTTGEQPKESPVLTVTKADIANLNAEIAEAQKVVAALPIYKEYKSAEADYNKKISAEIRKTQLWKEWKTTEKQYVDKINRTEEFKRLAELMEKSKTYQKLIGNN